MQNQYTDKSLVRIEDLELIVESQSCLSKLHNKELFLHVNNPQCEVYIMDDNGFPEQIGEVTLAENGSLCLSVFEQWIGKGYVYLQ